MTPRRLLRPARQRGAALLLAMIVLTLVATLAAAMISQQDRAIRVEGAERAREQVEAVSSGALQIARMLLREDVVKNRSERTDHLGETWSRLLPETEVSTLISSDERSPTDREGLRAFISGRIEDANARFNLRNLVDANNDVAPDALASLKRLCESAGVEPEVADRIALGLQAALKPQAERALLMPTRLEHLGWFGIDAAVIRRLADYVVLLPASTKLNLNTAPAAVLAAAVPELTAVQAAWIEANRPREGMLRNIKGLTVTDLRGKPEFAGAKNPTFEAMTESSSFFIASARLRIGPVTAEERWLLWRRDGSNTVEVIDHERLPAGSLQLER